MAKLKAPAYQWYPRDYIASTRVTMMTLTEEAIYRKLMDYCWLEGSISADVKQVQRLIGKGCTNDEVTEALKMFEPHTSDDTKLIHPRLDMQRKDRESHSKKCAEAANIRWGNSAMQVQCKSNASAMQTECSTSASSYTTSNKEDSSSNDDAETVWKAYPNKQGKKRAIPAIKKALKKYSVDELKTKIDNYVKTCRDPKYIAHGCTWFCGERYEDDLTPIETKYQSKFGSL